VRDRLNWKRPQAQLMSAPRVSAYEHQGTSRLRPEVAQSRHATL